jgi:hypothetical protein
VGTDVKTKGKGEAARTKQETVGIEFAAGRRLKKEADRVFGEMNSPASFWSSAVRRKEADRVLDLKSKSKIGKKLKRVTVSDIP